MNARPHLDKSRFAAVVAGVLSLIAACVLALAAQPANAASLVRVTDFGIGPTSLNMYVYTPGLDISSPALLVLVHPCGGSANGIIGGNGHDYLTAADRHKFLILLPEATRDGHCFDVSTPNALRRNGGGDSTEIMAMVARVRERYRVDPARIVVAGFSSGAMMANLLAAQYPDVFSAGAAYSGVPAGCFATTDGSLWNSQCSGGTLLKSPQQWGDQARAMYPGYTGSYPKMQLWHGTTDTTLAYPNFGEELDQWTNLRGVSRTPSTTDQPQPGWTRTRYGVTSAETAPPVEGISVQGTGHTLPLPRMIAYSVTFLGLDRPPPTTTTTAQSAWCRAAATVSPWNTGLTETITITNPSTIPVNGWQLRFTLPGGQTITNGWSATYSPTTGQVTARNADYNARIPPGGSVSIGFLATHTGDSAPATEIALNGVQCIGP